MGEDVRDHGVLTSEKHVARTTCHTLLGEENKNISGQGQVFLATYIPLRIKS